MLEVAFGDWLELTPGLQLVPNWDDDLEMAPGFRIRFAKAMRF